MKKQIANTVYILQNIAVPILIFFFVSRDLLLLAYATVILSKWRMVAVAPRFWLANLRSNGCDIIVGLSTVALMSNAPVSNVDIMNPLLAVLYAVWLLFIKPRSGKNIVMLQAFVCQFYGLTSLFLLLDHSWQSFTWLVIPAAWVVGRVAARHFLSVYEEVEYKPVLISLWGFLIVQLAWVFWIWNIIYPLPAGIFAIPLISFVAVVLSYSAAAIFIAKEKGRIEPKFIVQQLIFVCLIMAIIINFTDWTGQV